MGAPFKTSVVVKQAVFGASGNFQAAHILSCPRIHPFPAIAAAAALDSASNAADRKSGRIVLAPLANGGAAIGRTYLAAANCTSLRSTNACNCGVRVCKPLARSNAWRAWAGWLSACKAMPSPIHQTLLSGAACRASW